MASLDEILPYASYYARATGVPQVVYHSPKTGDYGRLTLPEWNARPGIHRLANIAKLIQPGA